VLSILFIGFLLLLSLGFYAFTYYISLVEMYGLPWYT